MYRNRGNCKKCVYFKILNIIMTFYSILFHERRCETIINVSMSEKYIFIMETIGFKDGSTYLLANIFFNIFKYRQ